MDHFTVHTKLSQHCKSIILQLRQKLKRLAACPWRYCQYTLSLYPLPLPVAKSFRCVLGPRGRRSVGFPPESIRGRLVHPWHRQEGCSLETTAFQLTAGKFALFLWITVKLLSKRFSWMSGLLQTEAGRTLLPNGQGLGAESQEGNRSVYTQPSWENYPRETTSRGAGPQREFSRKLPFTSGGIHQ